MSTPGGFVVGVGGVVVAVVGEGGADDSSGVVASRVVDWTTTGVDVVGRGAPGGHRFHTPHSGRSIEASLNCT